MSKNVEVIGIEEIEKVLDELLPKHARNLSRSFVHGLASEVAKESKKRVPTDTGNLKKSIKAKRKRSKPETPVSEVIVTTGKNAKNDGFYWRFVEYGTGGPVPQSERPFLRPARDYITAHMKEIADNVFTKKLAALVKREKKKADKK